MLTPKVREESLFIYADVSRTQRIKIDEAFIRREGLDWVKTDLSADEKIAAVRFGSAMNDGEAQAFAVAFARVIPLVSDDNAVARAAPGLVTLETTLELVKAWSGDRSPDELRAALVSLRIRANFAPPRAHPLREWLIVDSGMS